MAEDRKAQRRMTPIYIELPAYTGEHGSVRRTEVVVDGCVYVDYDAEGKAVGVEVLEGTIRGREIK